MTDDDLLRYSRHILLDDLGIEGQQCLLDAHALIIGAGGLGCTAALYLGASGVGSITLVDDDTVELSNLQRQIAHTTARIGSAKVHSLRDAMHALNPHTRIHTHMSRADEALLDALVPTASVVLDGSDNYATRHAINAACVRHRVPLVSGSALRWQGQVSVFDTRQPAAACYACLFDPSAPARELRCAEQGVLAPLVGIIASVQATEAIKLITAQGQPLTGRLLTLDARNMHWRSIHVPHAADCPVCGG